MAFSLMETDNRGFFYQHSTATLHSCRTCTLVLDDEWVNPDVIIDLRGQHFTSTHDGALLVSDAFKDAVVGERLPGCVFRPVPRSPMVNLMTVEPVVKLDTERAATRFGPLCPEGRRHTFVVEPGRCPLLPGERVGRGFNRTDLAFGDAAHYGRAPYRQSPVIIVSNDSAEFLRHTLQGIVMDRIEDNADAD